MSRAWGACVLEKVGLVHDRPGPGAPDVTAELQAILESGNFDASPRSRAFLRFIVEETLAGRQSGLTQAMIATRVFGRRDDFDATVDPVVRIQAGRLRRSLERYYLLASARDPVRIELPRGAYVPRFRWSDPPALAPINAAAAEPTADPGGWPVVVLDFDTEAAPHFLDHLTVELGRYADVQVVRRQELDRLPAPLPGNRSFALTGDVAQVAGRVRVAVRLVASRTAHQVWAEEYAEGASEGDDFLTRTAQIVAARVASEQGAVVRALWADGQPEAGDESTYGALLRSYRLFFGREPAELAPTLEALQRAVTRDPSASVVWLQLARLHVANHVFDIAPATTSLEQGLACANSAAQLDPASRRARAAVAFALLAKGELETGRAEAERALALNPSSLVYLETIGWLLAMLGDWERGLDAVRTAMLRNPHHLPIAQHALWADHLRRGEVQQAFQAALQYRDSGFFWRSLMQACCLGLLGRGAEAASQVADLLRARPDFQRRGRTLIGRLIRLPELHQQIVTGLAGAGLELE
jgi:adenylate cyclase